MADQGDDDTAIRQDAMAYQEEEVPAAINDTNEGR